MSVKFKDAQPRKPIDKAGLVDIYTRLFGAPDKAITVPELRKRIRTFGSCECDDRTCREPFRGYCEYDHKYLNASARKGDTIHWQALTKVCHAKKTRTRDTPNAAKAKRHAKKYNREYMPDEPTKVADKPKIQSGGFQPRPEGHVSFPKRGQWIDKARYDD